MVFHSVWLSHAMKKVDINLDMKLAMEFLWCTPGSSPG